MSSAGDVGARLDRIEGELSGLQAELAEIRASTTASADRLRFVVAEPQHPTVSAPWRAPEPAAAEHVEPAPVAPSPAREAVPPPEPPPPWSIPEPAPRRVPLSERMVAWGRRELTGSRLFALGGGALMLLGVVFLFVVASNRGWIGPGDRVALGAAASIAALLAGLVLRSRYGRLQASLAAVGAGIAGLYATLAAATTLYAFVPSSVALLLAAAIASVGGAVALAWSSQLLAGLALVGAAAAPGLVVVDEGITAPAPAFAVVVLAATILVAARHRWLWLVVAVAATALPQVLWLVVATASEDWGAVAVSASAALVLLGGSVLWQAASGDEGLDTSAAAMALLGAGLALWAARILLPDDRDEGIALVLMAAVYAVAGIACSRRWRDLGWVVGGASLLLVAVATADLLSGRQLSVVLAVQAVVLAGLAWRLGSPRFELGALGYLTLGVGHVGLVELQGALDAGDVPRAATPALLTLTGAALAVGLLLPGRRADSPSSGSGAALEPLWDGLVRARPRIRAALVAAAIALAAAGSAGLLSGRWLTIAWVAAAAAVGLGAAALRERRVLAVAAPLLLLGIGHALSVEAPASTLLLGRGLDALAPVPSIVALGAACAVLGFTCLFGHRGLRWLGPLAGPERVLRALDGGGGRIVRATLLHVACVYGAWAAGLVLIDRSYAWGQAGATLLWAVLGLVVVARGAATRSWAESAGWGILAFAFLKAVTLDWNELAAEPAATSLLVVSAALLVAGFASRWLDTRPSEGRELMSLFVAAVATASSVAAIDHVVDDDQAIGAGLLVVAAVLVAFAVPPFLRRRRGAAPAWARTLATGYWVLALATLLPAESALTSFDATSTLTVWSATAALLAVGWQPAGEPRLWIAALFVASGSTGGVVTAVTTPDRLVEATAHPGRGFSALVVLLAAAVVVAWLSPPFVAELRVWLVGWAAALGLFTVSIAVLELAERVSGASVETDFQRGHTALSTLLGLGALAVYVIGLARDHRGLRLSGLTLFGLALAKLFLYDLSSLSSITRAMSFLALGAVLLAAAFFAERAVRGQDGPGAPARPRSAG